MGAIVSIHAPVKVRTLFGCKIYIGNGVSIHAPVKVRTLPFCNNVAKQSQVSIHAPVKVRTIAIF